MKFCSVGILIAFTVAHAARQDETDVLSVNEDVAIQSNDETKGMILDAIVKLIRWGLDKGFANSKLPVPIKSFDAADCSNTHIGIISDHRAACTFSNIVIGNPAWDKLDGIVDAAQQSDWKSEYMLRIKSIAVDIELQGGVIFSSVTGVTVHKFNINGVYAKYETVPKLTQPTGSWWPGYWYESVPGPNSNVKLALALAKSNENTDSDAKKLPSDDGDAAGKPMPNFVIEDESNVGIFDINMCYMSGSIKAGLTVDIPVGDLVTAAKKWGNFMPATVSEVLQHVSTTAKTQEAALQNGGKFLDCKD